MLCIRVIYPTTNWLDGQRWLHCYPTWHQAGCCYMLVHHQRNKKYNKHLILIRLGFVYADGVIFHDICNFHVYDWMVKDEWMVIWQDRDDVVRCLCIAIETKQNIEKYNKHIILIKFYFVYPDCDVSYYSF
jgi:hypothetical protein